MNFDDDDRVESRVFLRLENEFLRVSSRNDFPPFFDLVVTFLENQNFLFGLQKQWFFVGV